MTLQLHSHHFQLFSLTRWLKADIWLPNRISSKHNTTLAHTRPALLSECRNNKICFCRISSWKVRAGNYKRTHRPLWTLTESYLWLLNIPLQLDLGVFKAAFQKQPLNWEIQVCHKLKPPSFDADSISGELSITVTICPTLQQHRRGERSTIVKLISVWL